VAEKVAVIDERILKVNVSDISIGTDGKIRADGIKARGTAGLKLQDNAGEGIHIKDGGDVTASKGLSVAGPLEITTLRHNIQKGNIYYPLGRPRVLNLATTDADLKGFQGGFTDGCYGYFVPYSNGAYSGKVARVDLNNFSSVSVLNLTTTYADLKGFVGGFTDGRYGYFVPCNNGARFGKVARVDLNDFSSVSVLNLATTDANLKGFTGGFTDGRYGYFVPYYNGVRFGKVARVLMRFGGNL